MDCLAVLRSQHKSLLDGDPDLLDLDPNPGELLYSYLLSLVTLAEGVQILGLSSSVSPTVDTLEPIRSTSPATGRSIGMGNTPTDFFEVRNGQRLRDITTGTITIVGRLISIRHKGTAKYVVRGWLELPNMTILKVAGPWSYRRIESNLQVAAGDHSANFFRTAAIVITWLSGGKRCNLKVGLYTPVNPPSLSR